VREGRREAILDLVAERHGEVAGGLQGFLRGLPGEHQPAACRLGVALFERAVELQALMYYAHRVRHPVVQLAADPLPFLGLGAGPPLAGEKAVAILLGLFAFCHVGGDPRHATQRSLLVAQASR
jgi:hypothetical protein